MIELLLSAFFPASKNHENFLKVFRNLVRIRLERLPIGAVSGKKIEREFKHFPPWKVKQNEIQVAKARQAQHNNSNK
tara:strand:+ start:744 stop:974 length:231 start_codon:yes stop_codon:yes gene_type:complete